uniref:Uncharacterized protein n=1 Tax=Oryza punctata TaxID=4537 RepID=A0A0E0JEE1_ORYPU
MAARPWSPLPGPTGDGVDAPPSTARTGGAGAGATGWFGRLFPLGLPLFHLIDASSHFDSHHHSTGRPYTPFPNSQ